METSLLQPREDFVVETFDEFEKRYFGFGKEIYLKVKDDLPEIFNKFVFYRRLKIQSEDSYAEFRNDKFQFCIQLDPICEVIALWNDTKEIEIGYYSENKFIFAINYIISEFMK